MKRKWIYSVLFASIIFRGTDVSFGAANCPGMDETTRTWGGSVEAKIPEDFVDDLNASIKALLPTLECVITQGASVTAGGTKQDCCDDGTEVSDGLKIIGCTAQLAGSVSGNLVGAKYTKTKEISWFGNDYNIKAEFDLGLSLSCTVAAQLDGGYSQNDCLDESWGYGGLTLDLDPTLTAGATGEVCIETDNKTNGLTVAVVPAEVSASFTGTVGYNKAEDECGWYGNTVLNNIRATTSVDFPFIDPISATYEFYPTPHWLAEGEE